MIRVTIIAVALALFSVPLFAQDQTVEPTSTIAETNSDCTTSDAHTRTNDNSDATFCDGGDGSGSESYSLHMALGDPSSGPSTTTDAQEFQCRVQKSSAGGDNPTFRMDAYCNSTLVETGGTEHSITSASPAEFTETWTFNSGTCASDGSDVEIWANITRTGGTPSGRKSVDTVDCDWDVTYATGTARRAIVIN